MHDADEPLPAPHVRAAAHVLPEPTREAPWAAGDGAIHHHFGEITLTGCAKASASPRQVRSTLRRPRSGADPAAASAPAICSARPSPAARGPAAAACRPPARRRRTTTPPASGRTAGGAATFGPRYSSMRRLATPPLGRRGRAARRRLAARAAAIPAATAASAPPAAVTSTPTGPSGGSVSSKLKPVPPSVYSTLCLHTQHSALWPSQRSMHAAWYEGGTASFAPPRPRRRPPDRSRT